MTHEEIFRELRDDCATRSRTCRRLVQRKFFYVFTCEYCFSHYVALAFVVLTGYRLLVDDWRGLLIAWLSVVGLANVYIEPVRQASRGHQGRAPRHRFERTRPRADHAEINRTPRESIGPEAARWCGLADLSADDPDLASIRAAVAGDADAFEALVRRYEQRIVSLAGDAGRPGRGRGPGTGGVRAGLSCAADIPRGERVPHLALSHCHERRSLVPVALAATRAGVGRQRRGRDLGVRSRRPGGLRDDMAGARRDRARARNAAGGSARRRGAARPARARIPGDLRRHRRADGHGGIANLPRAAAPAPRAGEGTYDGTIRLHRSCARAGARMAGRHAAARHAGRGRKPSRDVRAVPAPAGQPRGRAAGRPLAADADGFARVHGTRTAAGGRPDGVARSGQLEGMDPGHDAGRGAARARPLAAVPAATRRGR